MHCRPLGIPVPWPLNILATVYTYIFNVPSVWLNHLPVEN